MSTLAVKIASLHQPWLIPTMGRNHKSIKCSRDIASRLFLFEFLFIDFVGRTQPVFLRNSVWLNRFHPKRIIFGFRKLHGFRRHLRPVPLVDQVAAEAAVDCSHLRETLSGLSSFSKAIRDRNHHPCQDGHYGKHNQNLQKRHATSFIRLSCSHYIHPLLTASNLHKKGGKELKLRSPDFS